MKVAIFLALSIALFFTHTAHAVAAPGDGIKCQAMIFHNGLVEPISKPEPIGSESNPTAFLYRKGMKKVEIRGFSELLSELVKPGGLEKYDGTVIASAKITYSESGSKLALVGLNLDLLYVDKDRTEDSLLATVGGGYGRVIDGVPMEVGAHTAELKALDGDMLNLSCTR